MVFHSTCKIDNNYLNCRTQDPSAKSHTASAAPLITGRYLVNISGEKAAADISDSKRDSSLLTQAYRYYLDILLRRSSSLNAH